MEKNNLLTLRNNLDTVMAVWDELEEAGAIMHHGFDEENFGFWAKIPTRNGEDLDEDFDYADVNVQAIPGSDSGISVKIISTKIFKQTLDGEPSVDEVIDTIEQGMEDLGIADIL
jgi:hypothetical protein